MKILTKLTDSYFAIVLVSILVGIALPSFGSIFSPYIAVLLGIIFFLSSLKIDLKETSKYLSDLPLLLVVNAFMLLVFPVVVFFVVKTISPALALPLLILAAMPAGMTAPLLSEISGGRQSLALVLTVTTSLLAPVTVPLVILWLTGSSVEVGFMDMFLSLAKVIFIPFILAQVIKRYFEEKYEHIEYTFKPISIILLMLLVIGVVAKQADTIIEGLVSGSVVFYLTALFIFFILIHLAGYWGIFWKKAKDRITVTVCLTYMNFTLAIYLSDKFFSSPDVIVPIVLSVIPWALLLPVFKFIAQKR